MSLPVSKRLFLLSKFCLLFSPLYNYTNLDKSTSNLVTIFGNMLGNRDPVLDTENYIKQDNPEIEMHTGGDHAEINRRCYELLTDQDAIDHNIYYLENEAVTFNLSNGATFTVFASPLSEARPNGRKFFQYAKTDPNPFDEMEIPENVDILITHGPPRGHLDVLDRNGRNVGCKKILRLVKELKPLLHVFGHVHEGRGQEIIDWDNGMLHTPFVFLLLSLFVFSVSTTRSIQTATLSCVEIMSS